MVVSHPYCILSTPSNVMIIYNPFSIQPSACSPYPFSIARSPFQCVCILQPFYLPPNQVCWSQVEIKRQSYGLGKGFLYNEEYSVVYLVDVWYTAVRNRIALFFFQQSFELTLSCKWWQVLQITASATNQTVIFACAPSGKHWWPHIYLCRHPACATITHWWSRWRTET